ncbi:MAG: hypothetical protein M1837_006501 [Sclerophora amabilis]|nr:MAG: hypothetical protein M1837_006501 [Sclerophora amabilis]
MLFDQGARTAAATILLWNTTTGARPETYVVGGLIICRFAIGVVFTAFTRPQFHPLCIAGSQPLAISMTVVIFDSLVLILSFIRLLHRGAWKNARAIQSTTNKEQCKSFLSFSLGYAIWFMTSIPMLLGLKSIPLFVRTAVPATGLFVFIALLRYHHGALLHPTDGQRSEVRGSPLIEDAQLENAYPGLETSGNHDGTFLLDVAQIQPKASADQKATSTILFQKEIKVDVSDVQATVPADAGRLPLEESKSSPLAGMGDLDRAEHGASPDQSVGLDTAAAKKGAPGHLKRLYSKRKAGTKRPIRLEKSCDKVAPPARKVEPGSISMPILQGKVDQTGSLATFRNIPVIDLTAARENDSTRLQRFLARQKSRDVESGSRKSSDDNASLNKDEHAKNRKSSVPSDLFALPIMAPPSLVDSNLPLPHAVGSVQSIKTEPILFLNNIIYDDPITVNSIMEEAQLRRSRCKEQTLEQVQPMKKDHAPVPIPPAVEPLDGDKDRTVQRSPAQTERLGLKSPSSGTVSKSESLFKSKPGVLKASKAIDLHDSAAIHNQSGPTSAITQSNIELPCRSAPLSPNHYPVFAIEPCCPSPFPPSPPLDASDETFLAKDLSKDPSDSISPRKVSPLPPMNSSNGFSPAPYSPLPPTPSSSPTFRDSSSSSSQEPDVASPHVPSNAADEMVTVMLDHDMARSLSETSFSFATKDESRSKSFSSNPNIISAAMPWHFRVGDRIPTFSQRASRSRSNTMPPPTPLLFGYEENTPSSDQSSRSSASPLNVIYGVQERLRRYKEPPLQKDGESPRNLESKFDQLDGHNKDFSLVELLEKEMGAQQSDWLQMQESLDRESSNGGQGSLKSPTLEICVGVSPKTNVGRNVSERSEDSDSEQEEDSKIISEEVDRAQLSSALSQDIQQDTSGLESPKDTSKPTTFVDVEPPESDPGPLQQPTTAPVPIESSLLWQKQAESPPMDPYLGITQTEPQETEPKESALVQRKSLKPKRKSKRVTFLPDIIESPQPIPGRVGALGVFQLSSGISDSATSPRTSLAASCRGSMLFNYVPGSRSRPSSVDPSEFKGWDEVSIGDDEFDVSTLWEISALLQANQDPRLSSRPISIIEDFAADDDEYADGMQGMDGESDDEAESDIYCHVC